MADMTEMLAGPEFYKVLRDRVLPKPYGLTASHIEEIVLRAFERAMKKAPPDRSDDKNDTFKSPPGRIGPDQWY